MASDSDPTGSGPASLSPGLHLALVHHPVLNRHGETITSQLDSFDFFDLSRISLTYPIAGLHIVNPLASQRAIFERLVAHANAESRDRQIRGHFDRTHWADGLDDLIAKVPAPAPVIATTARPSTPGERPRVELGELRSTLEAGASAILVFGKAWGLTSEFLESCDGTLQSVDLGTGYNHLSVRSAVAIVVDRLFRPA